jgi:hypothetical protein
MPRRPLVIDVTKDLPHRATPLSEEALSQVFGGCIGMWQPCTHSSDCCAFFGAVGECRTQWDYSHYRWVDECSPTVAPPLP